MAGKVKNIKSIMKYPYFKTIFILVFSLTVILSGCVDPQQNGTFADGISPEQKKVELKKKLERRYKDSETHFLLAQLYHAERNFEDADFHYNRALQYDPVYRPAQAGKVKLYIDRGETLRAQHYFDECINQIGDYPIKIVELAREFQEQNVDTYALTCFNKALELAPKSAEVNKYFGYYYLSRNNEDMARKYFEESFIIDSTQKDVSRELGNLGVPVIYEGKPPVP